MDGSWPHSYEHLQKKKSRIQGGSSCSPYDLTDHQVEFVTLTSLFIQIPLFHAHLHAQHLPSKYTITISPPMHIYLSSIRANQEEAETNFGTVDDPGPKGS